MAAAVSSLKNNARKRTHRFEKGVQKYASSWKGRNVIRPLTQEQKRYWASQQIAFRSESRKRMLKIIIVTSVATGLLLVGGYAILSLWI